MRLALPIVGGMVSQNLLNLVDTAMVGQLGAAPLAAVGIASIASFLVTAFITGLSSGVQAMAARRLGEQRASETAMALNGGLLFAVGLAMPWSLLLFWLAPSLFPYLNGDPAVVEHGVPYLQARLVGMAAVGMNFAFRGYFNGVSRSGLYLRTLLVMHSVNVVLNYILIFGKLGMPALGATGAGIGTTISMYVGTATYFFLGLRHARTGGFLRALPSLDSMRTMLRLSVPSGLQQMFFAGGFVTLFWIIGQIGTTELAATNILVNLTLVTILPAMGLGIASASLVGQALGRKDAADARRWGWDVVRVAVIAMVPVGLPMLLVPESLLRVFTADAATVTAGHVPLQIIGASIVLDAIGFVLLNSLLGAGAARKVMVVSVSLQWLFFLPVAFLVGPWLGYGLVGIWLAQVVQRVAQAAIFARVWRGRSWATVSV